MQSSIDHCTYAPNAIRNPPECIMSISIIMSLIMTLLVFQCGGWEAGCRVVGCDVAVSADEWPVVLVVPARPAIDWFSYTGVHHATNSAMPASPDFT